MFQKITQYLVDVKVELGKVSWPTRSELISSTNVVVIITAIFSIFIFGLDTILSNIMSLFL